MIQMPVGIGVSQKRMTHIMMWMEQFSRDWTIQGEIPLRIHESGMGQAFGLGSAPPFAPEFMAYVGQLECKVEDCAECTERRKKDETSRSYNRQSRTRTTRTFRKLRKYAPREFDACYLAIVHHMSLGEIAQSLTDRSYARGFDEPYDRSTVLLLIVSGMDKLTKWY
jgi:hypothetical protein